MNTPNDNNSKTDPTEAQDLAEAIGGLIDGLKVENKRLRECLLYIRDECDWEEYSLTRKGVEYPMSNPVTVGDNRIGQAIDRALANAQADPRSPDL